MTKKKRELIDILLDNVKPEDWPENFEFAIFGKKSTECHASRWEPFFYDGCWNINKDPESKLLFSSKETPKHWNKTIAHRDEFMRLWNERNRKLNITVTRTPPATMDSVKYEALEFEDIGGVKDECVALSRGETLTYQSIPEPKKPDADSEGWIKWNGGEMPVEKGTLIDVKYRDRPENIGVIDGVAYCETGSNPEMSAVEWKHSGLSGDIIAYRIHVPQQQKTPQQLALEKFGTDWHDNEGVQPVDRGIKIDITFKNGDVELGVNSCWRWDRFDGKHSIEKWRIHSDDKESSIDDAVKKLTQPESKINPESEEFKKMDEICMSVYGLKPEFIAADDRASQIKAAAIKAAKSIMGKPYPMPEVQKAVDAAKSLDDGFNKLNGLLPTTQQAFDGFKKAAESMSSANIKSIIADRGINYGRFEDGAEIMQQLKLIAHTSQGWERMKPIQREGIDMILHKIGRILNGDPSYIDSWVDIEGYSNLVSSWLKGESK